MDYQIQTEFQGPGFVAVPNSVAQSPDISADALGVLVYLASQPHGFIARVAVIQERFGMGKDKWQRIARELRDLGAMQSHAIRGTGGRVIGKRVVVRWPELPTSDEASATESRETRPSDRKPEKPAAGKSAKASREIRQSEPENPAPYKEEKITKARRGAARPCEGPAASYALGTVPTRVEGGKRRYQGPDGGWYQKPDCPDEAKAFENWLVSRQKCNAARASGRG